MSTSSHMILGPGRTPTPRTAGLYPAETDSRRKTRAQTALDTQRLPDPQQQHSTLGAYRRRASYRTPHLHGQPSTRTKHTEEPQSNDAPPNHAGPDRRK
ncbi:Hypothetical predicted protein, partial [Pelobates cultripes]